MTFEIKSGKLANKENFSAFIYSELQREYSSDGSCLLFVHALSSAPTFFNVFTLHRCALNATGLLATKYSTGATAADYRTSLLLKGQLYPPPSPDYKVPYLLRDYYTTRYRSLPEIQISDAAGALVPVISIKEPGCLKLDLLSVFVPL